jgi:hypothetical protein
MHTKIIFPILMPSEDKSVLYEEQWTTTNDIRQGTTSYATGPFLRQDYTSKWPCCLSLQRRKSQLIYERTDVGGTHPGVDVRAHDFLMGTISVGSWLSGQKGGSE